MAPAMSEITIHYNPFCEISRNALALIRHAGIEPTIVEYMRTPLTREKVLELLLDPGPPASHTAPT